MTTKQPTDAEARSRIERGLMQPGTNTTRPEEAPEPRPIDRIAAGIAASDEAREAARVRAQAALHREDLDVESDRIGALDGVSPTMRIAVGLHNQARQAAHAHKINNTEETS